MTEHIIKLNGDLPQALKIFLLVVDRVGFPTLAFCAIFYVAVISQDKLTKAINENSLALVELKSSNFSFQGVVKSDHEQMKRDIQEIQKYSYGYQDHIKAAQ